MSAIKLISTSGDQTVDLAEGRSIVVGRAVTSDLPIYDPTVSRRHAEVVLRNGSVSVRDLGSSNGTFINGTQITDQAVAQDGDTVTFGKVAFRVREVTPPAMKPPPKPEAHAGFGPRPPEATIVRQLPVEELGNIQARIQGRPSGASQLKVIGDSTSERQSTKLSLLLDISKELSKQQEVDKLLQKVVDITFQVMNVDRVSMLMVEGSGELVPRVSKNRLGDAGGSRHVPQSIARRAVNERLAILTDNAAADERFKGQSILMQSVRSAMCTPLMGSEGKVLGIIYVDNLTATNSFGDEDLEFLIAFSGITAVAIENSQLTERVRREAVVLSNFQRYFAPNVAAEIASQAGSVKLGSGEKRPVVIFFSDIRGFTPMSETMGPDEITTLLSEYFTEMVEIIFEHEGTLDKFIGDAIMAIWGAPLRHEDDADRAMRAAINMQRVLVALNKKWGETGRRPVNIGIGINFGEVFAGNIGSDRRLEYTVIGDAVNTASRLCSKAGPGEIIISEPFFKQLKHPPALEAVEPMQLKGKAQAVQVYRVKL
ncbi:MAG: FHA domain-containing protein [Gemmatimonadetes bacterium]|nr:FHA domain-containing protein [Gemmatimonadota bacterium]